MTCIHGTEVTEETICRKCMQDLVSVMWSITKPIVQNVWNSAIAAGIVPEEMK